MDIKVSIVLVNYNTKELTAQCVESIQKHTTGISYEIIIVDNGSVDGSVEFLSHYTNVLIVESGGNVGFGRGNNAGVKRAAGEYVFLLNTDTLVLNNAIKILFDYCESHQHEKLGVVGCWLMKPDRTITTSNLSFPSVYSTWNKVYRYFLKKRKGVGESMMPNKQIVNVVSGADMFIKKQVYEAIGGFDEDYFMYGEEVELQYRLHKKEYEQILLKGPQIIHLEGSSSGNANSAKASFFMMYSMKRGRYLFYRKHKSLFHRILVALLDFPIDAVFVAIDPRFSHKRLRYFRNYFLLLPYYKIEKQTIEKKFYL